MYATAPRAVQSSPVRLAPSRPVDRFNSRNAMYIHAQEQARTRAKKWSNNVDPYLSEIRGPSNLVFSRLSLLPRRRRRQVPPLPDLYKRLAEEYHLSPYLLHA